MTGKEPEDPSTKRDKLATIDNDGVTFKSHLDGSFHRFDPEISMQIQHHIGADIIFAFDELTTLYHPYEYQIESLNQRTHPWAERSLAEHQPKNFDKSNFSRKDVFARFLAKIFRLRGLPTGTLGRP
jgi:queuine tRNA-ribosyltransferase